MTQKFTTWAISIAVLGGILGWLTIGSTESAAVSDNDTWQNFEKGLLGFTRTPDMSEAIIKSGLIGGYKEASDAPASTDGPQIPDFPQILSSSKVNGIAQVHLRGGETGITTAVKGDTLESGWQLLSVNLSGVVAMYGDEERTINITNYDLQPEPENAEPNSRLE